MLTHRIALVVAAAAALAAPGAAGAQVSDVEAVGALNAQRQANGIPPVELDAKLSIGCRNHVAYMAQNSFGHGEDPSKPGYTPEGAGLNGYGGSGEVLSYGGPWGTGFADNPWSFAPIHLMLMFDPGATRAGYFDSEYACMRFGGWNDAGAFYSLPGPGVSDVPTLQDASGESPYSPADAAGLPTETTGFNIVLYGSSRRLRLDSATLVGPDGPEPIRLLTEGTTMADGNQWRWGTIVVPEGPYQAGADYVLTANWEDGTVQRVPFRTAGTDPELRLRLHSSEDESGVWINSYADNVRDVTVTGPGDRSLPVKVGGYDSNNAFVDVTFHAGEPGRYVACATTGGGRSGYSYRRECAARKLRGHHKIEIRQVRGGIRVVASKSAHGLSAWVRLSREGDSGYGRVQVRRWERTIRLRGSQTLRVPKGRYDYMWIDVPTRRTSAGSYWPVELSRRWKR